MALPVAADLLGTLEELADAGKIRWYGWSTDLPDRAAAWARDGARCTAIQQNFSVFEGTPDVLAVCEEYDLASIDRGPLAMGLLTGKFDASSTLGTDDVRGVAPPWLRHFRDGRPAPEFLDRVAAVREVLTTGGRTSRMDHWPGSRPAATAPCRSPAAVR